MRTPVVYVGHAVTNGSPQLRSLIMSFKLRLREVLDVLVLEWDRDGYEPTVFYDRDFGNVRMCDAMIAMVSEPSLGLGMEIQEAIRSRKPLLCLHDGEKPLSRLLASAGSLGLVRIERYGDMDDAVTLSVTFIKAIPL